MENGKRKAFPSLSLFPLLPFQPGRPGRPNWRGPARRAAPLPAVGRPRRGPAPPRALGPDGGPAARPLPLPPRAARGGCARRCPLPCGPRLSPSLSAQIPLPSPAPPRSPAARPEPPPPILARGESLPPLSPPSPFPELVGALPAPWARSPRPRARRPWRPSASPRPRARRPWRPGAPPRPRPPRPSLGSASHGGPAPSRGAANPARARSSASLVRPCSARRRSARPRRPWRSCGVRPDLGPRPARLPSPPRSARPRRGRGIPARARRSRPGLPCLRRSTPAPAWPRPPAQPRSPAWPRRCARSPGAARARTVPPASSPHPRLAAMAARSRPPWRVPPLRSACAARPWRVCDSFATRQRGLARTCSRGAQCVSVARRARDATHSVLSRPRHGRLPRATCLPPCAFRA
jgi:hypothetical protein